MSLTPEQITEFATRLDHAAVQCEQVPKLTAETPFTLEEAYEIQRANIALRASRGDAVIGWKMGLTSLAKMQQMGVHDPIYGVLTKTMAYSDGDVLSWAAHGQPKIEPEIAFLMGRDLHGDVSPAEALLAVDGVCGALEVIDSRYVNFDFTLNDVVADNASSRSYILGSQVRRPGDIELGNLGMVLKTDGATVAVGSSAAILEHPARSLARLAKMLARHGESIQAGQVVLAGAATAAVTFTPGMHVRVEIDGLGAVETSMGE